MSEHRTRWSRKRSTDAAPAPPEPKDTRPWDPDEDPSAYPTDGGSPAVSKSKRKPLGEWPLGAG